MQVNKKLFALDIGTRSVVGIILEEKDGQYHVVDVLSSEHKERSMLDGQIHDVLSVSKIILEIKEQLEIVHGPLKKVCVAAAGRALKTERAKAAVEIDGKPLLTKQDILHLELSAVQQAQAAVAEKHEIEQSHFYYCVGYSVLYYHLDNDEIGSLIDQQGKEASVEIIATFLPKVVVESLIAALGRAGLEMEALTLEPIAAINVLIPPSMRRLNVALVDVGAGTSDIALTDTGTVVAYGMVPVAGDEITEAISDEFLLDFPLAEKAKRDLYANESIKITDILGFETELSKDHVIKKISPSIDRLAESITDEILSLNNNKPPKAVMLVGGGSLTPELPKRIAMKLNLPENRVAIRGIDAISSLTMADHIQKGPELVTPIGIAIAAKKSPVQYRTVYVNGQPVRLFEVKKLSVGDCLLAAGIKMNKLYGRPGLAMIVSINGTDITIPGKHGEPPVILRNGGQCSFDDEISHEDQLVVEKGVDGKRAKLKIADLIDEVPKKLVHFNGKPYEVTAKLTCNGLPASPDKWVEDRDKIEFTVPRSIEELIRSLDFLEFMKELRPFRLKLNDRETVIPKFSGKIYRNGLEARLNAAFDHLDDIRVENRPLPTIKKVAESLNIPMHTKIPVFFNGKEIMLEKTAAQIFRGEKPLSDGDLLSNGDEITVKQKPVDPFIFQDLFNHVKIEIPKDAAGQFFLLKNDENATFYDKLSPGDHLKIVWKLPQQTGEIQRG
ncbi:cell division protein FtsA [Bacillus sp. T33-2]|uniref:cell division protein FtsA n=1 Tax=Bacillus sp. T33-2 TaxID=2054168 RepID=UPI000C75C04F|nr:cell division protein FtsA [Bacillus sp. T33-2]PLR98172.1 cell division protein [Bacillus sp. T33-2]